jgi:hypothetical protein
VGLFKTLPGQAQVYRSAVFDDDARAPAGTEKRSIRRFSGSTRGTAVDFVSHRFELIGQAAEGFRDLRRALRQFPERCRLSPQECGMCGRIHGNR